MHDLFKIIYADHQIDKEKEELLKKYAIGLWFSEDVSEKEIIKRSMQIFAGQLTFQNYHYLLNNR